MKSIAPLLALSLCLAVATAADAADPNLARNLAATCAGCHGTDGRSAGGMASLAGVPQRALMEKLRAFRAGEQPATIMHQIAKGYSDEQLSLITAYFAGLDARQP